MEREIICVFAKAPTPGEVKTRLAELIGDAGAAELARAFIVDIWFSVQQIPWARPILAITGDVREVAELRPAPECWDQGEGDLGHRMERILRRALRSAPRAYVIGTDLPGLPMERLVQARAALDRGAGAVLGPVDDGGFFLLGLDREQMPEKEGLLAELPWSCADTLQRTTERLGLFGLSVALIDSWFDVDHPEDFERMSKLIRQGKISSPAVERFFYKRTSNV